MSPAAALAALAVWASPPARTSEVVAAGAAEQSPPVMAARTIAIRAVRLEGIRRTRSETLLELLPREPPAQYRVSEIAELERRINNLGIFDDVATRIEGDELVVAVREKFTLTPSIEFATGRSVADIEGSIGATEYNFLGRGSELGAVIGREQRGPVAWAWYLEHAFRPRRWAFGVSAGIDRASLRFGDPDRPDASWFRDRGTIEIGWRTPYGYGGIPLRYEVGGYYTRELIERDGGAFAPPDGHSAGTWMAFTWDRYTWRDLVPDGLRVRLFARPGWYLPEGTARFTTSTTVLAAAPLGKLTVLATRTVYELVTEGNVNHSTLVGSQDGVRGLADAFYRNRQQVYTNVELRHALKLADRWALQLVAFADAAAFEPMDMRGRATSWKAAIGTGGGMRLIPTFLTQLLLRADLARLYTPEQRWFLQVGVTQYF